MRNQSIAMLLSFLLFPFVFINTSSQAIASKERSGTKRASVMYDSADGTVRRYLEKLKNAQSIEDLQEFMPSFRLRKISSEFTQQQKDDWLRYRKQMPKVNTLISKDLKNGKMILVYRTRERRHSHRGTNKTIAEITLVKEHGQWKVFLEHFGPENEKSRRRN